MNGLIHGLMASQGKPNHKLSVVNQEISDVGDTVRSDGGFVVLTATAGAKTLTSTPSIAPGVDGQVIVIQSQHTSGIALQDQGTLVGSGVSLNAAAIALGIDDVLMLIYSEASSAWCQMAFQGNSI